MMNRKRPTCPNRTRVPGQSGFTLIEVLLALTLTTLLVTLLGRIAVNSFTTRQAAERVVARMEREERVFASLREDFANMLDEMPGDQVPLLVFGMPRQVLQLSVLAAVRACEESLHLIKRPATVRYRLVGDRREADDFHLIREVIDRTSAAAAPVPETIATGIQDFDVEVLHRKQWIRKYPPGPDEMADAGAVRVSCKWMDSEQAAIRTFFVGKER